VTDFGIAKARKEATSASHHEGMVVGNDRINSPRSHRRIGMPLGHLLAGVVLYQMLAGVPPFEAIAQFRSQ